MEETNLISNLPLILFSGIFVAAASGLVGSFLALRKMTLLSDALSHVALPGLALGILFNFEPLLGGLGFLAFSVLILWSIEEKTKLAVESITGVLFTVALAIGTLLIPEHELLEAFFGNVEKTTPLQASFQITLALLIIAAILFFRKRLVLFSIAPDLSKAEGISNRMTELLLLGLIAITITLGISFVGVLLMSALLIIPAVSARNLASSYRSFLILSITLAVLSLTIGILIAHSLETSVGVTTALVGALIFAASLLKK